MLSTVIPVYNEVESLPTLLGELDVVARAEGYELEVVFVDDGSTDGSWEVIRKLASVDPHRGQTTPFGQRTLTKNWWAFS